MRSILTCRGDAYLYTITTDTVFRVYSPVLDDPTWFQLLSTLDARSFRQRSISSSSKGKNSSPQPSSGGTIIPLDAETARKVVDNELQKAKGSKPANADLSRKLQALQGEEVDLVLWIGNDGAVALSSILVSITDKWLISSTKLRTSTENHQPYSNRSRSVEQPYRRKSCKLRAGALGVNTYSRRPLAW